VTVRTLVVDCYLRENETKMARYVELARRHSAEVETVAAAGLGPGHDLAKYDAVIISGSQWMLSQDDPRPALRGFCRELSLPTLGICFGHQLLARSFGASVVRGERFLEFDEQVSVLEQWPLFEGLCPTTVMRESHRELVTLESVAGIGWQLGARSASCPVEALRHPFLPLYGVQFHPERSGVPGERLFENFYTGVVGAGRAGR
jgi:GMP synthase (glutamine-hydrolysing)